MDHRKIKLHIFFYDCKISTWFTREKHDGIIIQMTIEKKINLTMYTYLVNGLKNTNVYDSLIGISILS